MSIHTRCLLWEVCNTCHLQRIDNKPSKCIGTWLPTHPHLFFLHPLLTNIQWTTVSPSDSMMFLNRQIAVTFVLCILFSFIVSDVAAFNYGRGLFRRYVSITFTVVTFYRCFRERLYINGQWFNLIVFICIFNIKDWYSYSYLWNGCKCDLFSGDRGILWPIFWWWII